MTSQTHRAPTPRKRESRRTRSTSAQRADEFSYRWSRLPRIPCDAGSAPVSRRAPVLRWLDDNRLQAHLLAALERLALQSDVLQRFLIDRHARAFRALLSTLDGRPLGRIGVVGGGLFPRTVVVLRRLLPASHLCVIDESAANIARAREWLDQHAGGADGVEFTLASFAGSAPGIDLLVLPLGLVGDRDQVYRAPPAPLVVVHDWLWRARGKSVIVSLWLLKRLNLVRQDAGSVL